MALSAAANGLREREFRLGNPEDQERHNSWPMEELLPGFRHFTEDFYRVRSPPRSTIEVRGGLTVLQQNQDCAQLIHQLLQWLSLALT